MISKETFLAVFTGFSSVDNTRLEYYLEQAQNQVDESAFGVNYTHAVYLRLAHMLTLLDPSTAGQGPVTSEKAGDVQYSYSYIAGEESLSQSKYGLEFMELRKENVVGAIVL